MAKPPGSTRKMLRFTTVGLELGLSVLIGLFIGQYLDARFDTEPWLLLLFLFFGMAAGFRSLFRLLKEVDVDDPDEPGSQDNENTPQRPG